MIPGFIPVCDPCLEANAARWGSLLIRRSDQGRWCSFCRLRHALVAVSSRDVA